MFTATVTYANRKTATILNVVRAFLVDVKGAQHELDVPCEKFSPFPPGFSASGGFEIKGEFLLVTDSEELRFPLQTARTLTVRPA